LSKKELRQEEAFVEVSQTYLKKKPKEKRKRLMVRTFVTEAARVSIGFSQKLSVKSQYEPSGVYVNVSIPCYTEEIESATVQAEEFAEKLINKFIDRLLERE